MMMGFGLFPQVEHFFSLITDKAIRRGSSPVSSN